MQNTIYEYSHPTSQIVNAGYATADVKGNSQFGLVKMSVIKGQFPAWVLRIHVEIKISKLKFQNQK